MDLKDFIKSKPYLAIALLVAVIAVLFLTFSAGMFVGFHKARFSYQWGENYHKNFGGPQGGFLEGFRGKDLIDANGVAGQIMKIDNSTLVIRGRDDVEKIVAIKNDSVIKRFNETVKLSDLKIDDLIVVIGEPNNSGQIEAKFIRVLPAPATSTIPVMPMRGLR